MSCDPSALYWEPPKTTNDRPDTADPAKARGSGVTALGDWISTHWPVLVSSRWRSLKKVFWPVEKES